MKKEVTRESRRCKKCGRLYLTMVRLYDDNTGEIQEIKVDDGCVICGGEEDGQE